MVESISSMEGVYYGESYEELETFDAKETEEPNPSTQAKSGATLDQARAEESIRSANVWKKEKSQKIYVLMHNLLQRMEKDQGNQYPEWVQDFEAILHKVDSQSYKENQPLFDQAIDIFLHPPHSTPPSTYVPLLKNLAFSIFTQLDFSKGWEVGKGYLYATNEVPNLVDQAKKELELGNRKQCEELLARAKEFVDLHYSNIPILSDKRMEERAKLILMIADIEKNYHLERAFETLSSPIRKQSEGMKFNEFAQKWLVVLFVIYVSRRAIFG